MENDMQHNVRLSCQLWSNKPEIVMAMDMLNKLCAHWLIWLVAVVMAALSVAHTLQILNCKLCPANAGLVLLSSC